MMALFGSVSGKDVDGFAKTLAQDLAKRYPPALDKGTERKISQKRNAMFRRTAKFAMCL